MIKDTLCPVSAMLGIVILAPETWSFANLARVQSGKPGGAPVKTR